MTSARYPLSALVGQERMVRALLLAASDPRSGGLLLSGHKGTAKTTAVRALAALLPPVEAVDGCPLRCAPAPAEDLCDDCRRRIDAGEHLSAVRRAAPFVELPLNADEDRLAGSLDLSGALSGGGVRFEPGLLARAHRGALYVDEVNLLADHLTDMLLDAAASGWNTVEREGISRSHPARFLLLGTMNPEEGDLRPQLLDRFALMVHVEGLTDPADRAEVARRRAAFEDDPPGFASRFRAAEEALSFRVAEARARLASVRIPDAVWLGAAALAVRAGVQGHRADIAMVRTAAAAAALDGRDVVDPADLAEAARFVLPHRLPASPARTAEDLSRRVEELVAATLEDASMGGAGPSGGIADGIDRDVVAEAYAEEDMQVPGSSAGGNIILHSRKKKALNGT